MIIDDGGHKQSQIGRSFDALWPLVQPGGVYVVEDLQVARSSRYEDTNGQEIFIDKIKDWTEQLLVEQNNRKIIKFPIPTDISFIFCQLEACVIGKHASSEGKGIPSQVGHDFHLRARR